MKLLVLRFSAMGDVALLVPVVSALAKKYSNLTMTLVTRSSFEVFFHNIPGVEVVGVDIDKDYKGLLGIYRLYRELRALGPYDYGIDVHASLRSRLVKLFFRWNRLAFATIVKGRREKRMHTRRYGKVLTPLPHVVERYMHVFERAGYVSDLSEGTAGPWINPDTKSRQLARGYLNFLDLKKKENYWIGIAPFAGHQPKMWPLGKMQELLLLMRRGLDAHLFLFGGGDEEIAQLEALKKSVPESHVVAGRLTMEGELGLMMRMDLMIAMDSFNMHMAALLGIPVLSIWGATHPYSGFGPYGQDERSIVQIAVADLSCRPCSIFGDKSCYRGDLACLNWISPKMVFDRVMLLLGRRQTTDDDLPQTD